MPWSYFVLLILYFSQRSVATRCRFCRCGGKYNTSLVANLLLSLTVKEFRSTVINVMNEYQVARFYGPWCTLQNNKLLIICQSYGIVGFRGVRRNWWCFYFPSLHFPSTSPLLSLLSLPSPPLPLSFPTSPIPSPALRSRFPLNQLGGLGSAVSSPSGVRGAASAVKRIWCTLELSESHWWQSFWVFWSACFTVDRSKFSTN